LELKAEKDNAEIRLEEFEEYQSIVEAEWRIIFEKCENCVKSGANVILSRLAIGDVATQYFADRNMFCAGRVGMDDLLRVTKATGALIQTTVNGIDSSCVGECGEFEEIQIGAERYNIFNDCPKAKTATILLRGGGEQFIEEMERSIHDAVMIVSRAIRHKSVVGGGGAIEMELSKYLREHSRSIDGKQQLIMNEFAKALEVIPRQVADNAGLDSTTILNKLRKKHAEGGTWIGVDIRNDDVCDTMAEYVWEPSVVKLNCITAATEAACQILSIDETVKNASRENKLVEDH